jgi:isoamylase
MTQAEWDDANARAYAVQFSAEGSPTVLLLVNGATNPVEFTVPKPPAGPWKLVVSSDPRQQVGREVADLLVGEWSTTVLRSA